MTMRQTLLKVMRDTETDLGLKPNSVSLLAVSKGQSIEKITAVYAEGQRLFGENYLQEALEKMQALNDLDIEWHFIGQIQSNKTKQIAENFSWVQSVASLKIAERLNQQRPVHLEPLNICIQVNISNEAAKGGVEPEALFELARAISHLKQLTLRGIMVIPKDERDYYAQLAAFERARDLFIQLQQQGFVVDTLSMGMSGDFKAAMAAGSTMLRLGSAVFGPRDVVSK